MASVRPASLRGARLARVIRAILPTDTKTKATADYLYSRIHNAILQIAEESNCHRCVVRRDVIRSHGYTGRGAQRALAIDIAAAAAGDPTAIRSRLRKNDVELVMAALRSTRVATKTATRTWLETGIKNGLLRRLSIFVQQRFPSEEKAEIDSMIHVCIALWADRGSFDAFLEINRPPSMANLTEWVSRRMASEFLHRGTDALHREIRGARTGAEVVSGECATESLRTPDVYDVAVTGDDGDLTYEIVSKTSTPEVDLIEAETESQVVRLADDFISEAVPKSALRRSHVLRALLRGATREDLVREMGVRSTRARHLTSEVRDILRNGALIADDARKVLTFLADEPWATVEEVADDVGFAPERAAKAATFLEREGLITRSNDGRSFAPTNAGRFELEG